APPDGREPFTLDTLDGYALEQELLARKLAGEETAEIFPAVRNRGLLPAGTAGEVVFRDAVAGVEAFASLLLPLLEGEPFAPLDLDLGIENFQLSGRVSQIWPQYLLRYRCAGVKAKDRLDLWIDHLSLQCIRRPGDPKRSILVAKEGCWNFRPVTDAQTILRQLLNHYWEGLREPLRFFPQAAYGFAKRRGQGKTDDDAMSAARRIWQGDERSRGECEDPYYRLNFGKVDPLDEHFAMLALGIFGPLLGHEEAFQWQPEPRQPTGSSLVTKLGKSCGVWL
ncbi:MAG: hypothetical protein L0312_25220, partial [Acidobacteria bacterium]|nr:hypothetical protein [Acidobacteriota bacterium]